eukprot:CAMPEP_0179128556 /NCGR_PEP_ID=MMETSP0796-20121207/60958_1 /TAXON_ID=73915 /ORGANISM="Pyrodinium bahamense, Strain pbaha01" /LENGTH=142 /DNA_ID=CAMNT_0020827405 /DNA_START=543 /DNA_END=973 /DNA_ORIENTATION=+
MLQVLRPVKMSRSVEAQAREQTQASSLSEQQESKEACVLFVTDGSGEVDSKELEVAMRALGFELKKGVHQEMAPDVDDDRIGTIGYEEVPKMAHKIMNRAGRVPEGFGASRHACAWNSVNLKRHVSQAWSSETGAGLTVTQA